MHDYATFFLAAGLGAIALAIIFILFMGLVIA